jgi:hypothetical protein
MPNCNARSGDAFHYIYCYACSILMAEHDTLDASLRHALRGKGLPGDAPVAY